MHVGVNQRCIWGASQVRHKKSCFLFRFPWLRLSCYAYFPSFMRALRSPSFPSIVGFVFGACPKARSAWQVPLGSFTLKFGVLEQQKGVTCMGICRAHNVMLHTYIQCLWVIEAAFPLLCKIRAHLCTSSRCAKPAGTCNPQNTDQKQPVHQEDRKMKEQYCKLTGLQTLYVKRMTKAQPH
jgi:hypothetical protein